MNFGSLCDVIGICDQILRSDGFGSETKVRGCHTTRFEGIKSKICLNHEIAVVPNDAHCRSVGTHCTI